MQARHDTMFPPPPFFASQEINFSETVFRNRDPSHVAIHYARESLDRGISLQDVTWGELRKRTETVRDAMVAVGLSKGDRVAAVMSNSVDAIVFCLASLSIGALWSSASCEMGAAAIVDRFLQIEPTLVFADRDYVYAARLHTLEERIENWSHELGRTSNSLQHVVLLPSTHPAHRSSASTSKIRGAIELSDFLAKGTGRSLSFASTLFNDPAFILHSSGTVSEIYRCENKCVGLERVLWLTTTGS